jgi:hypothetical protein
MNEDDTEGAGTNENGIEEDETNGENTENIGGELTEGEGADGDGSNEAGTTENTTTTGQEGGTTQGGEGSDNTDEGGSQEDIEEVDPVLALITDGKISAKECGAIGNGLEDDTQAIQTALDIAIGYGVNVSLEEGVYLITQNLIMEEGESIVIQGNNSRIKKSSNFESEYLLKFELCNNIVLRGVIFEGLTSSMLIDNVWGEQGVMFSSSSNLEVAGCEFYNFGDAALRITSDANRIETYGMESNNIYVHNNYFSKCTQITTTPGGSAHILYENNVLEDMRHAMKFASRYDGAMDLTIKNNTLDGTLNHAIEIVAYQDVTITGNCISNAKGQGILIYPNITEGVIGVPIKDYVISNNSITNCNGGHISISNRENTISGTMELIENIVITGNYLEGGPSDGASITLANGPYQDITISDNTIKETYDGIYMQIIADGSTTEENILIDNNTLKGMSNANITILNQSNSLRNIRGVTITNNYMETGQGITLSSIGGSYYLESVIISGNEAYGQTFLWGKMTDTLIEGNIGICQKESTLINMTLNNSTVNNNSFESQGVVMRIEAGSSQWYETNNTLIGELEYLVEPTP